MTIHIDINLIPQAIREKFTLPESVLIMRLYELARSEWENEDKGVHRKPWGLLFKSHKDLMDNEFVSLTVVSSLREKIREREVPFLFTSSTPTPEDSEETVCCYLVDKAGFDAFCGVPVQLEQPAHRQKEGREYLTRKEVLEFINEDTALFDRSTDLMLAVGKVKSKDICAKDVLNSWTCWELYPRADVERLIENRAIQCSIQFLIEPPIQSTTEPTLEKGE